MLPKMPPKLFSHYLPSLLFLSLLFLLLFNSHPLSSHSTPLSPSSLFLSLSSPLPLSSHLKTLTLAPHLAGTPSSSAAAAYVHLQLGLSGLQTLTSNYSSLLSYPSSSSLSLLNPNLSLPLPLSEPADAASLFVPPYHAFSPSGAALASAVYANYGRDRDYETLQAMNVDVNNCIVIVRRGAGPRGVVVERAAESGVKAVLMFGEKAEDGGVERGTVLIGGPGDMTTPGWAGGERLGMKEVGKRFPRIPSMPVSVGTAREILKRLKGPPVPEEWRGEVIREWGGIGGGGGGEGVLLNFTYQVNLFVYTGLTHRLTQDE